MQRVLYVKLPKVAAVTTKEICLGQVAELSSQPPGDLVKWQKLILQKAPEGDKRRVVWSALDIQSLIYRVDSQVDIRLMGEVDVVIDCRPYADPKAWKNRLKAALSALVSFIGGAFAIMTFNQDVELTDIFKKVYFAVTGEISVGKGVLEAGYSLGLFLGMVIFFNHLAGWKLTEDPTPLEVQMRQYENDVDEAIVEYAGNPPQSMAKAQKNGSSRSGSHSQSAKQSSMSSPSNVNGESVSGSSSNQTESSSAEKKQDRDKGGDRG
ncbi:MAG: stage V sporulation protein AA [Clostridiales bacterium]|nr:stage V sporulation protein AA [Clostridiales bacterium]